MLPKVSYFIDFQNISQIYTHQRLRGFSSLMWDSFGLQKLCCFRFSADSFCFAASFSFPFQPQNPVPQSIKHRKLWKLLQPDSRRWVFTIKYYFISDSWNSTLNRDQTLVLSSFLCNYEDGLQYLRDLW